MLVNMADKLQNTSQFFRCFTIPPNQLDAQIPCPGPYLFHSIDMQNQFPHYSQELRTGTVALTGQMKRQAIYLNCGGTISQSARKETALCGTPLQRSSIPFLKTREYQATALVRSVRHVLSNASPTTESTNGSRMQGMRLGDQH